MWLPRDPLRIPWDSLGVPWGSLRVPLGLLLDSVRVPLGFPSGSPRVPLEILLGQRDREKSVGSSLGSSCGGDFSTEQFGEQFGSSFSKERAVWCAGFGSSFRQISLGEAIPPFRDEKSLGACTGHATISKSRILFDVNMVNMSVCQC